MILNSNFTFTPPRQCKLKVRLYERLLSLEKVMRKRGRLCYFVDKETGVTVLMQQVESKLMPHGTRLWVELNRTQHKDPSYTP